MYRCDECNKDFEELKALKDDAGVYYVSPCCKEGYEEVYKCSLCGDYHYAEDIYKNICYKCAEKEYTNRLGLKFIDKHKDFYLEHRGIYEIDKEEKDGVIEDLKEKYLERIDMDNDWNHQLEHLKYYVLEDIDVWIEFLKEELNV